MGLIGDRKSKKQKEKEKEIEKLRNAQNLAKSGMVVSAGSPLKKKGLVAPLGGGGGGGLMRYPAGYYTTPAPSSQMWAAHPGQPRHHHGHQALPQAFVGHAERSHFDHVRVHGQRPFHFGAIDIFASGNDHVFATVDDGQEPTGVEDADISRAEPATGVQ